MAEVQFPSGFRVFSPNARAPEYILGEVVISVDEFAAYMRAAAVDGELKLTLKRSQAGKLYAQVNTWRPSQQGQQQSQPRPAPPPPPPFSRPAPPSPPPPAYDGIEPGDEELDSIPF